MPCNLCAREVQNCTLVAGDCSGQWELESGSRLAAHSVFTRHSHSIILVFATAKYAREEVRPELLVTATVAAALLTGVKLFACSDLISRRLSCSRHGRSRCAEALCPACADTERSR